MKHMGKQLKAPMADLKMKQGVLKFENAFVV